MRADSPAYARWLLARLSEEVDDDEYPCPGGHYDRPVNGGLLSLLLGIITGNWPEYTPRGHCPGSITVVLEGDPDDPRKFTWGTTGRCEEALNRDDPDWDWEFVIGMAMERHRLREKLDEWLPAPGPDTE